MQKVNELTSGPVGHRPPLPPPFLAYMCVPLSPAPPLWLSNNGLSRFSQALNNSPVRRLGWQPLYMLGGGVETGPEIWSLKRYQMRELRPRQNGDC